MKRSPLPPRKKYLPRSTKRINSRKPGKPRRRAGACRPYPDWLTTQACCITGKRTGAWTDIGAKLPPGGWQIGDAQYLERVVVDPAHVRVKKLGGDLNNAISLAHHLHTEWHQIGRHSWCRKYGLTWAALQALAVEQTESWLQTAEGQAWVAERGTA